jgi:Yip1 domain
MSLLGRVKAILFRPEEEWRVIEGESAELKTLYSDYLCILALFPAFSTFVCSTFVGVEMPAGLMRLSVGGGILCAIYSYFMVLAVVYIAAMVTDWLAPKFGAEKNFGNALKLSVYCNTPYCLAAVFSMIPGLNVLGVLGLYGLYLFYVGAPIVMKSAPRSVLYPAAVFVIVFIVALPLGAIQALLFWL